MIVKAVLSTWMDSTEPSDALQITPHYRLDDGAEPAATTFATALLNAWKGYIVASARTAQLRCTVYNAQAPSPNYPITSVTQNQDASSASVTNRETAVCLSYYAGFNRPRYRGRLYVPMCLTGLTASQSNISPTIRDKVLALGPVLAGVLPSTSDWVVYSRVDNVARAVSNTWVDDSFDVQRRRGRRATARTLGTIVQ